MFHLVPQKVNFLSLWWLTLLVLQHPRRTRTSVDSSRDVVFLNPTACMQSFHFLSHSLCQNEESQWLWSKHSPLDPLFRDIRSGGSSHLDKRCILWHSMLYLVCMLESLLRHSSFKNSHSWHSTSSLANPHPAYRGWLHDSPANFAFEAEWGKSYSIWSKRAAREWSEKMTITGLHAAWHATDQAEIEEVIPTILLDGGTRAKQVSPIWCPTMELIENGICVALDNWFHHIWRKVPDQCCLKGLVHLYATENKNS
jgi:hypothetical protein